MNYHCVFVFHKMTSLSSYFLANKHRLVKPNDPNYEARYQRISQRYTRQQDVKLILLVRYERVPLTDTLQTICKINCPVNPLPVKDEFKAPSIQAVKDFLSREGWIETESIADHLLM